MARRSRRPRCHRELANAHGRLTTPSLFRPPNLSRRRWLHDIAGPLLRSGAPGTDKGITFILRWHAGSGRLWFMPRSARTSPGGVVFHCINRGNNRAKLFTRDGDYVAFEKAM